MSVSRKLKLSACQVLRSTASRARPAIKKQSLRVSSMRYVIAFVSLYIWILAGLLTVLVFISVLLQLIFLYPFDKNRRLAHAQGFWWADLLVASNPFLKVRLKGLENIDHHATYVVVANHQSLADIVFLYKTHMQFKWVAKESLFKIPIFGWCMRRMKYINLSRGEFGSVKKAYEQAEEWLRKGISVLFFPEGTRSTTGSINEFKNGAFKLAIKEQKPILPVHLKGSGAVIPRGSWILKEKSFCEVTVLPPIQTAGFSESDFARLRDLVRNNLLSLQ